MLDILDEFVDEIIPSPNTKERWQLISDELKNRWNVQNACGALDVKHVATKKPAKSGSQYYNYKCLFSIIILALVDANYQFLWADVGGVGSQPDGQIYNASELAEVLRSGEINPPDDAPLPNDDRPHQFFFLADDVFPLKSNMMKPYSRRNLSFEEKIANYRISRGSRVVENAFGILALRWQCLLSTMQQKPNVVQVIVKTTMVLHNLMRSRYPVHHEVLMDREDDNGQVTPEVLMDREDDNGQVTPGDRMQTLLRIIIYRTYNLFIVLVICLFIKKNITQKRSIETQK